MIQTSHATISELSAQETRKTVHADMLSFATTADLAPLNTLVGQERAVQALQVGLGMPQPGYNIFVSGFQGLGAQGQIESQLRAKAAGLPTPGDWVYVHNFRHPEEPQALALEAGQGNRLQQDMAQFVSHLKDALPKAFREKGFDQEQRELSAKYEQEVRQMQEAFNQFARDKGFDVQTDTSGNVMIVPVRDGRPMSQEDLQSLSDEERQELDQRRSDVMHELRSVMQRQRQLMQRLAEEVREVVRNYSAQLIAPLIDDLKHQHLQPHVHRYLDAVQEHILSHLNAFKSEGQSTPEGMLSSRPAATEQERFVEYTVNVIVDNSNTQGAPVLVEDTPTYKNLFGAIERVVDPHGRVVSNFTRIRAGSVLRANGGYVLFNLEDALTEPFVWKTLKRVLQSRQIKVEAYDPFAMFTVSALQPEAVSVQTKVVVTGSPWLYYLLYFHDPDFAHIFKIKADFGHDMARTEAHETSYARLIARLCQEENLIHYDPGGVTAVIEEGMRRAGDQEKLVSQFGPLADLVREASYVAKQEDAWAVGYAHVAQALQAQHFRANRLEEQMRDRIAEGTLLIETEGFRVGQLNGLSVLYLGDHVFGHPSRVTATTAMGRSGIVNIEREAKLSGSTHDKGILILSGYLRQQYAQDKPLALSASLCFEQSYSGVDGDSASSTELYALLSSLADLPLRQDLAVTGSVNQWGEIQAIGGVNEKIEGFYDVCVREGLTGNQGVVIPQANVRHLMLRPDVVDAIQAEQFHIYPITHIDQGLALLTGELAGEIETPGTVHYRVNARLQQLAQEITAFDDRAHSQNGFAPDGSTGDR
jgi:predicted ATP-dependent protease